MLKGEDQSLIVSPNDSTPPLSPYKVVMFIYYKVHNIHMEKQEQICTWKRCQTKIIVKQLESPFFTTVGWCDFHDKVYAKEAELFDKLGDKHHSEISNDLYLNNRKEYNRIENKAIRIVQKEIEN